MVLPWGLFYVAVFYRCARGARARAAARSQSPPYYYR